MKNILYTAVQGKQADFWSTEVAWFCRMKSPHPSRRTLQEILEDIRGQKWGDEIRELREILRHDGEAAYEKRKVNLPSLYVSGCASSAKTMCSHSSAIQVDYDKLGPTLPGLKRMLESEASVAAVFTSPGGNGLKAIFRIEPLANPLDKGEHKRAVHAIHAYLRERHGISPDPSCVNVNRHCLVSSDPELSVRESPVAFAWRAHAQIGRERERRSSSPKTQKLQDSEPTTLQDYGTTPLHDYNTTPHVSVSAHARQDEHRLAALRFRQEIEESEPYRFQCYLRLVERRREAKVHERNVRIVEAVPFLFRSLSEDAIILYMEWFYRFNAHLFLAPLDKHMEEVKSMLRGVQESYPSCLTGREREMYMALTARNRAAFRICRDLAFRSVEGELPPPAFFLSHGTLAARLNRFQASGEPQYEAGSRSLLFLETYEIVRRITPGTRRTAGKQGNATRYEWLFTEGLEIEKPTEGSN